MDSSRFLEVAKWAAKVVWPTGSVEVVGGLVVFALALVVLGHLWPGGQRVREKVRWWLAMLAAGAVYYGFQLVSAASAPDFPYPDFRQPLIQLVFVAGIASVVMLAWLKGRKREPEPPRLLVAQRRLRAMEARVRQLQARFLPSTQREQVDGELLRMTFALNDSIRAELRSFLEPATADRILPARDRWRAPDGRLAAPPYTLLGALADSIRDLANDLQEHDLPLTSPGARPATS